MDGINFNQISTIDVNLLLNPFLTSDIDEVVTSVNGNKSLGPDCFNLSFKQILAPPSIRGTSIRSRCLAHFISL